MAIVCPNRGDHIVVANGLRIAVLETNGQSVTLGLCDASLCQANAALSEAIAAVCNSGLCYFWFPKDGCCTLVVKCEKGHSISLALARLAVLDVSSQGVTLAITGLPDESLASPVRIRARRSSPSMNSDGSIGQPFAVPAA